MEPSFPVQLDSCMPYQPCLFFKHLVVIQTPAQTTINTDKNRMRCILMKNFHNLIVSAHGQQMSLWRVRPSNSPKGKVVQRSTVIWSRNYQFLSAKMLAADNEAIRALPQYGKLKGKKARILEKWLRKCEDQKAVWKHGIYAWCPTLDSSGKSEQLYMHIWERRFVNMSMRKMFPLSSKQMC